MVEYKLLVIKHLLIMSLSPEQVAFLKKHGISEELLFDAAGYTSAEYKDLMKDQGKKIAFNVTTCYRGHKLRTRHGQCVQCRPANLAFIFRGNGTTYLAGSRESKSFKIGFTKSKNLREESLNKKNEGYGGHSDWELLLWIESIHAGEIEQLGHGQLKQYQEMKFYYHEGKKQEAKELFKGPYQKMKEAILYAILEKNEDPMMIREKTHRIHRYEFQ
ncbi:MAG: GIY-YIG nuclease family protein [Cyclobacteriaceae bacterium]